jgi:hypothetical protein
MSSSIKVKTASSSVELRAKMEAQTFPGCETHLLELDLPQLDAKS